MTTCDHYTGLFTTRVYTKYNQTVLLTGLCPVAALQLFDTCNQDSDCKGAAFDRPFTHTHAWRHQNVCCVRQVQGLAWLEKQLLWK